MPPLTLGSAGQGGCLATGGKGLGDGPGRSGICKGKVEVGVGADGQRAEKC